MSSALYTAVLGICLTFVVAVDAWGKGNDKVRLTDVKALTLHSGKFTTGRRSSPVPQLSCVGGTAGCKSFVPQVVQCYNQGSDGTDVQWECKSDLDSAYRFGQLDVICEGYDYPDDPYVLKGSCGLEYTLDLTEEGIRKRGGQAYSGSGYDYSQGAYHSTPKSSRSALADILFYGIVILLIYAIYRSCLRRQQYSPTGDDFDRPDDSSRMGFGYPSSGAPPPGFMPGFTQGSADSCGAGMAGRRAPGSSGSGGFWSGAMTGGALGYLFGNRNRGYQQPFAAPTGSSWSGGSSFGGSSGSFSSGTRTTSGFGGTRRR